MVYGDGIYGAGVYGGTSTITPAPPRPTRLLYPEVTVEIDGDGLSVREGTTVTLDAGATRYATARVDLPLLDDATLGLLDPRAGVRVPVTAGDAGGTPRVFDLGLRDRESDGEKVTLTLASDEAILEDYSPLDDDRTCLGLASSLRDIVEYVLGVAIPGAVLAPGVDADVTPIWSVTNLPGNSGFEGGSTAGYTGTNVSDMTITTAAGYFKSGTRGMRYTSTAAGTSRLNVGATFDTFKVTPGRSYTVAVWHRSNGPRAAALALRFYDSDGGLLSASSTEFVSPQTEGADAVHTARAPAGAATVWPYVATAGNSSGTLHYIDDVMIVEGEFLPDWFSGDTPDTATYEYAWAAGANASQSIRTALVDGVTPDALIWQVEQSAMDFLMVLCAVAGMVLWCDEARAWHLASPEDRLQPGMLSLTASNSSRGRDHLSRDDTDDYATAVVCVYEWSDRDGIAHRRIDSAGTPGKTVRLNFARPYPGPGVAAAMLARRQGTGRTQAVTSITSWDATPGMTASITLPGAPETTGRVAAVTFHTNGFMDVGTSGLVDVLPGSIATLAGSIATLTGTIADL